MQESQEENEQLDQIATYLRTLRKKVEHQLKNPFDMLFANFPQEKLASWQNNVLQLDATSRLYGQRVDFLHTGTLQVLGSVINSEQAAPDKADINKSQIKKEQAYEGNPVQQNLQSPQKISGTPQTDLITPFLWRQICKKRDSLHQLMLNQITIDKHLRVALFDESVLNLNDQEFEQNQNYFSYIKLIQKMAPSLQDLYLFEQIDNLNQELNTYMLNIPNSKEQIRQFEIDFDMYMDFSLQDNYEPNLMSMTLEFSQMPIELNQISMENNEFRLQQESDFQQTTQTSYDKYDLFDIDQSSKNSKNSKKSLKTRNPRKKVEVQREQVFIDFKQIILAERQEVIKRETQKPLQTKYLAHKNFLLLKFIKYQYPFRRLTARREKSKIKPARMLRDESMPLGDFSYEPISFLDTSGDQLNKSYSQPSANPFASKRDKTHLTQFKQAALPIKEMKRKIREIVVQQGNLSFGNIKNSLPKESPLDIFITTLHVAAEKEKLIDL